MMYTPPNSCPRCGSKREFREAPSLFTTGIPLAGGARFRLLVVRGLLRPRFRAKYRCGSCGFQGKFDSRRGCWK